MDRLKVCCFMYFCYGLFNIHLVESSTGSPQILVNGTEEILEVNGNQSFFCQGHKPLRWILPEVEDIYSSWTTIRIEETIPVSPMFRYGSRLHITNMTFPFVGFYYCLYENVEDEQDGSRIYLYVDDPVNLSVTSEKDHDEFIVVYARQFETVILPCRPTSPSVTVELMENEKKVYNAVFDRTTGFSLFVSDLEMESIYYCSFSRGNETFDYFLLLQIETGHNKSHIATPVINDDNNGQTTVGDELRLTCTIPSDVNIDFHWSGPHGIIDKSSHENEDNSREWKSTLRINETDLTDTGVYTCFVSDHQNHHSNSSIYVRIYDLGEHNLTMFEPNDLYYIQTYAGKESVRWMVFVWGHPEPEFTWKNNQNATISKNDKKYDIYFKNNFMTLTINYINISDLGHYTLTGANEYGNKSLDFYLNVTDKPSVIMTTEPFHMVGKPGKVNCTATAHPAPVFQWVYKPCLTNDCVPREIEATLIEVWDMVFVSQVEINATEPVGLLKCIATNFNGSDESTIQYVVSEFKNGFAMTGFDDSVVFDRSKSNATFAIGHPVTVMCGASVQKYKNLVWSKDGLPIQTNDKYKITSGMTPYSYKSYLEIEHARSEDSGEYSCRVESTEPSGGSSPTKERTMKFLMTDPVEPKITGSGRTETLEKNYPQEAELSCEVHGIPKPKITWYKSGSKFYPDGSRIQLKNDDQVLRFNQTNEQDEGTYECKARNEEGTNSKTWQLKIKNKGGSPLWYAVVIVVLFMICIATIACVVVKMRKEKRLQRELKLLGLANFEHGAVENINPDLGIDDQAELLPYDKKWEFPIEQLKLGKQLGSGAFGVVMRGEAKNILEGEPVTTVAVKMVKKNADHIYIKALASELKIMVHLGQHLNVVNLLGACTKNVVKKELLVIVEYCRYGNLQNYLLRHRGNFVNQVDPQNGKLNYNLGQDILDRTYSVSSNRSHNVQSPILKYAALAFTNRTSGPILPTSSGMGDYRGNQNSEGSATTDMTSVPQSNDIILSNNSIQPEWRSNYRGDYKGNVKPISTKDLLAWSFQVARGMDYLSSRKVLHGDLAARNILLADENIVKICDFGLAKTMYKNDNYKKRSDCPLPVRWMAIESIRDRIFSTQSDVWSFGIVLWELFSLARTPYPGMEADERLYHKLLEGYRMESPEYAPNEIYDVMDACWKSQPLDRPSFSKLTERLGNLLEDSLRKYYIDLNDPYLAMNTKVIEEGKDDYLAMVSPPTFEALSSPHQDDDKANDGYMSMIPGSIFSPRVTEGEVFDFDLPNRKPLLSESGTGHEMIPMLHTAIESDTDTPLATPNLSPNPNGFSNPSYHLLPPTTQEQMPPGGAEILKSADNYVNMPQNKNIMRKKTNEDEKADKIVDHNYVNGDIKDWSSVAV